LATFAVFGTTNVAGAATGLLAAVCTGAAVGVAAGCGAGVTGCGVVGFGVVAEAVWTGGLLVTVAAAGAVTGLAGVAEAVFALCRGVRCGVGLDVGVVGAFGGSLAAN
jgi:hypothetical protein